MRRFLVWCAFKLLLYMLLHVCALVEIVLYWPVCDTLSSLELAIKRYRLCVWRMKWVREREKRVWATQVNTVPFLLDIQFHFFQPLVKSFHFWALFLANITQSINNLRAPSIQWGFYKKRINTRNCNWPVWFCILTVQYLSNNSQSTNQTDQINKWSLMKNSELVCQKVLQTMFPELTVT